MGSSTVWIGLDLGEQNVSICAIDDEGETLHEQGCRATVDEMEAVLSRFGLSDIGFMAVESGTGSHLVRKLRSLGYPVGIFEARKARKFLDIRLSKTDASDARGLADIARLGRNTVSQVFLKSIECQRLRLQLALRRNVVKIRRAAELNIRSAFAEHGLRLTRTKSLQRFATQLEANLVKLEAEEGIDLRSDVLPLSKVCIDLRRLQKDMDDQLIATANSHPVCQRLMGVPGVGPICAVSFYSAIEDPHRFRRCSDVGGYLGLTPRRYQSGLVCRTRGISKSGNRLTRTHLVTSATALRSSKTDCDLLRWSEQLRARIGPARSKVALARKLATVMLAIWKSGRNFEPFPQTVDGETAANSLPSGSGGSDFGGAREPRVLS